MFDNMERGTVVNNVGSHRNPIGFLIPAAPPPGQPALIALRAPTLQT